MKRIVMAFLFLSGFYPLYLCGNTGLSSVPRYFPRQKVLAEVFVSENCATCVYANLYLDTELIPNLRDDSIFVTIRYRVEGDHLPVPKDRKIFYQVDSWPVLYLNGIEEFDPPMVLDLSDVLKAAHDSTTLFLDIQGTKPEKNLPIKVKVTVKASSLFQPCSLRYFLVLTESGIDPLKRWDPPFEPYNLEKVFNDAERLMITGEKGVDLTILPGDSLIFENEFLMIPFLENDFLMDPFWIPDSCKIVAFIQNPFTRQVFQAESRLLSQLSPSSVPDHPPTVLTENDVKNYSVYEGDTLTIRILTQDPDTGDSVALNPYYSPDGVRLQSQLPQNAFLRGTLFIFEPAKGQKGSYRFLIVGTDRHSLADTVQFSAVVSERPAPPKNCDFTADGKGTIRDVIAFLLLLRSNPNDPRLDWNGDGMATIADAVALLSDILSGNCSLTGTQLSASPDDRLTESPVSLNQEEFEYVEQAVSSMPLAGEQKRLLRLSFYKSQGREALPRAYSLAQNRPNPFNPSTAISYTVPENSATGPVSIMVFDIRGTLVKVLVEGVKGSGEYTVFWDGNDNRGRSLPSGIYFCRMQAKGFTATRKMLLLK
jgi:hypothetical protein